MDRKEKVKKLSEFLNATPKYLGVPSFAYEISAQDETYTIDRQGTITTSAGTVVTLEEILNPETAPEETQVDSVAVEQQSLPEQGGDGQQIDCLEIELPMEGHTGITLQNIVNMLSSKQVLIMKSFEISQPLIDNDFARDLSQRDFTAIDEFKTALMEIGPKRCKALAFDFDKGTLIFRLSRSGLDTEKINAFKDLVVCVNENAKGLKRASYKPTQDDNPKYAFRTWLIRLGMNGSEYKGTRKALMANLSGSGAFRTVGERVDG